MRLQRRSLPNRRPFLLSRREEIGSIPTPLIKESLAGAAAISHVYNTGGGLLDISGNSWTQVGTVPLTPRVSLGFTSGVTAPGFGPFSGSNYFQLGTGADVLDFGGAFLFTFIAKLTGGPFFLFVDGSGAGATGYGMRAASGASTGFIVDNGGFTISGGTPTIVADTYFIASFGFSAGTCFTKINSGAGNTVGGHTVTADATKPARIGVDGNAGSAFTGVIVEMCAWAVAPTQAMILSIHQSVTG